MSRREEVLSKVHSVQLMPPAAMEVVRLLQENDASISELTRAIECDPGLTSNVLRLANSAYFGCRLEVGSVRDAILRLGTKSILRLVMTAAFSSGSQCGVRGYDLAPGQLWEHSMAVALGATRLAEKLRLESRDELFTSAILHDSGKILLGTFVEVDAGPILEMVREERVSFQVAEQQILGIDHAEVGAVLLGVWNIPPTIVEAVRWHHEPDHPETGLILVDLVHVADVLSIMGGVASGIDGLSYHFSKGAAERLSLKNGMADEVVCETLSDLDDVRRLFNASETSSHPAAGRCKTDGAIR